MIKKKYIIKQLKKIIKNHKNNRNRNIKKKRNKNSNQIET